MMRICVILSVLSLSFCAFLPPRPTEGDFTAKPYYGLLDGKSLSEPIQWTWNAPAELGGNTTLSYNVTHNERIIFLDDKYDITGILCDNETMYIQATNDSVVANFTYGAILIGGKAWNCTNEKGVQSPFYRKVVGINYSLLWSSFHRHGWVVYSSRLRGTYLWNCYRICECLCKDHFLFLIFRTASISHRSLCSLNNLWLPINGPTFSTTILMAGLDLCINLNPVVVSDKIL